MDRKRDKPTEDSQQTDELRKRRMAMIEWYTDQNAESQDSDFGGDKGEEKTDLEGERGESDSHSESDSGDSEEALFLYQPRGIRERRVNQDFLGEKYHGDYSEREALQLALALSNSTLDERKRDPEEAKLDQS